VGRHWWLGWRCREKLPEAEQTEKSCHNRRLRWRPLRARLGKGPWAGRLPYDPN
jgi:hypothetical protein